MLRKSMKIVLINLTLIAALWAQAEVVNITAPTSGETLEGGTVTVSFTLASYFSIGEPACDDCDGYLKAFIDEEFIQNVTTLENFTLSDLNDGNYFLRMEAVAPDGDSFDPVIEDTVSFNVIGNPFLCNPYDLMVYPGDGRNTLEWGEPLSSGGGGDGGGDVIEDPFVVTGIPFADNGTTEGFNDDYDEACPFMGSTSPDVVYMFNTSGGTYDFSLCESGYDTKIYIYDINQVNIACNDDACSNSAGNPFRSLLEDVTLASGLYYVIVDGYGGASGEYQLLIDYSGTRSYNYDTTEKDPDERVSNSRTEYDFLGYNIYLDDSVVNTEVVEYSMYTVTGLSNEETYTFGVTAVYEGDPNYESEMITVTDGPVYLFGDITGTIVNTNGDPIDSCVVVSSDGVSDTTGADGTYTLWNLSIGVHTVQVHRPGFYTVYEDVEVLAQATAVVQNFVLSPDLAKANSLEATEGDHAVDLIWYKPVVGGGSANLLIEIMTDNYPTETSWDLVNMSTGELVASIAAGDLTEPGTSYTWEEIELTGGDYTWTIYDAYGDGICCAYGEGHYNIYVGGELIATGGEFEASESVSFNMAGRVMSVSHGSYAEPHGYAKGEVPPDIDIPIIVETTVYEQPTLGQPTLGQLTREQLTRELLAYNVYRAEGVGEFALLATVADTTGYLDGTVEYAEYSYYVTAEYSNGESDPTDTASVDLTNYPPTAFTLYSPADGDTIVIDQSNLGSDQAFAWGASTDPNGTAVEYNVCVTVAVPFDQFCEDNGTSTAQFVPLADIADYIDSLNQAAGTGVVLSLNWTVFASDGVNETEASNGPLSVTFDAGWVLGVDEEMGIPDVFALQQNYPNPFNPVTTIRFDVPQESHIRMDIYNLLGQRVRTLVNSDMRAGYHAISWNGTNDMGKPLSSGMYIYSLHSSEFTSVKKLVLMK